MEYQDRDEDKDKDEDSDEIQPTKKTIKKNSKVVPSKKKKKYENTEGDDDVDDHDLSDSQEATKDKKKKIKTKSKKPTKKRKGKHDESAEGSSSEPSGKNRKKADTEGDGIQIDEENPGQIKVLTTNSDQAMMIFLTLEAKNFKKFEIKGNPDTCYTIGLDIEELNKFIKTVNKDGTLNMYQDTNMMEYICFNVTNTTGEVAGDFELRRINIDKPAKKNIEVDVSMNVTMPCNLFHKACKDLAQFDSFVEFECSRDAFKIVCMSEQSRQRRIFTDIRKRKKMKGGRQTGSNPSNGAEDDDTDTEYEINITSIKDLERENREKNKTKDTKGVDDKDSEDHVASDDDEQLEIISLLFDLKYINYMYKMSNLCKYVSINLTPRGIMFLTYEIDILGTLIVGIAPHANDASQNYDEANDEFYDNDKPIRVKNNLN